jgi:tetratricopeptide (TPR) repeat protein
VADYTSFLKLEPSNKNMYRLRGHCYFLLGKYNLAIDDFTKAIEFAPLGASLYKLRGEAYLQKGEYQKAVDDLSQAMTVNKKVNAFATANAGTLAAAITGVKELATMKAAPPTDITNSPQNREEIAEMLHFRAIALDKMGNTKLAQKDKVAERGWGGYKPHDPRDRM